MQTEMNPIVFEKVRFGEGRNFDFYRKWKNSYFITFQPFFSESGPNFYSQNFYFSI